MTATPPVVVTIPPGVTVVYVAPAPRQFKRGLKLRDRGIVVTYRGMEEDIDFDLGHKPCRYKALIATVSARITIAAWHDDCGRAPRVELSAAGSRRPVRVGVTQVWSEGPPVEPEVGEPVMDPARLACTYDGAPVDVLFAPEAVTLARRFRVLLGPVTP